MLGPVGPRRASGDPGERVGHGRGRNSRTGGWAGRRRQPRDDGHVRCRQDDRPDTGLCEGNGEASDRGLRHRTRVPREQRIEKQLKKVRVCLIGAGQMANRVHYPSLASFDDVEMAAVCDIDEVRLRETAQRWGIGQTFVDYRQMVESVQPDAVYAIGQPHLMYDIWVWCLNQGCNLYIEKPMGLTLHQAQMLAHLAAEHDVVTQVSHQRRSSPLLQLAYQECRGARTDHPRRLRVLQVRPRGHVRRRETT